MRTRSAKASRTPFKRPENGQFRPGTQVHASSIFDETGDTNAVTEAGTAFGGFGAIFKLARSPSLGRTAR